MKKVILNSLTLTNFKGEHDRTTTFNADITTIAGANGLGKSRHFDAFLWLLFGKDKENRADYEIKTRNADGKTEPQIDVVVTGVMTVNGEPLTLTRKLVENWVKPRGCVERVFKGNETRCFWNDVPVSINEYNKRIADLINEQLFKMVTNPLFFTSQNWKVQREQLFAMAGCIDEDEIIAKNADFRALLDKMSGKSFDDFKAEIKAKKTTLRKELNEIQPRIDQTEKMKPESCDWIAIEKELDSVNEEIAGLDAKIAELNRISTDMSAAANAKFEETAQLRRDLMHCATRMDNIINDAVRAEKRRVHEANTGLTDMKNEIDHKKSAIEFRQTKISSIMVVLSESAKLIAKLEHDRDEKRKEWFDVNGKTFNESATCPTCGQPLPESMVEESRARFAENKRITLENITADGKRIADRIATAIKDNESRNEEIKVKNAEIDTLRQEIAELESKIAATGEEKEKEIDPKSLPEWVDAKRVYDQLSEKIDAATKETRPDTSANDAKIAEIKAQKASASKVRDGLMTKLNDRKAIEKADAEIATLTETGRKLAQSIADIERDEYIIGQYTKEKVELVESRIAKLFTMVKFKMFDYTIDGNVVETCVATVKGKPFPTVNTADQINAGLDIINALCAYYDVNAPIFIDNRESVNNLIPTTSQIINLVVTNDPELKVY